MTDQAEEIARRRQRNRLAQQKYRKNIKARIATLEKHAATTGVSKPCVPDTDPRPTDPRPVYQSHRNKDKSNNSCDLGGPQPTTPPINDDSATHQRRPDPHYLSAADDTNEMDKGKDKATFTEVSELAHWPSTTSIVSSQRKKPPRASSQFEQQIPSSDQIPPLNSSSWLHHDESLLISPELMYTDLGEFDKFSNDHSLLRQSLFCDIDNARYPSSSLGPTTPPRISHTSDEPTTLPASSETYDRQRSLPSAHVSQRRCIEQILEGGQQAGFESFDAIAIFYYTSTFEEGSIAQHAQKISRNRRLPGFLEAIRGAAASWTKWESNGYKAEIIRSAENLYADEFNRLMTQCDWKQSLRSTSADDPGRSHADQLPSMALSLKANLEDELPNLWTLATILSGRASVTAQPAQARVLLATLGILTTSGDQLLSEAAKWLSDLERLQTLRD